MPSYFPNKRNRPLGGGINPRAASNRRGKKYNLANATGFISGGRRMGEGVTTSGKGNIGGLKRAVVRGSRKGLDALVRAISTNIINNTENTQSNVTNFAGKEREKTRRQLTPSTQRQITNVTRVVKPQVSNLSKTVNNIRNQSFNNIRKFRDSRQEGKESGAGLFGGLFGNIRNGLDLLKLLTNKQTQKDLSKSINNLEAFFNDAYRVAYRLRKNLIKIFKALRKIRGGAGGFGFPGIPRIPGRTRSPNIPGMGVFSKGNKRRPKKRRGRGKAGLLLGLGAGALGMGLATNALAGEGPQIKSAETAQVIPEGFIDRFQSIVEKFSSVIDGFLNKKPKPAPGGGSGAAGGASPDPGSKDSIAGSMSLGGGAESPEEKAWLKTIREAEGTAGKDGYGTVFGGEVVPELAEGKMTINEVIQLQKTGKMPERLGGRQVNFGEYDGSVSGASGAYQFMPATLEGLMRNTGTSGDSAFTPKMQDQFALELLRGRGIDPTKRATIEGMNKAQVEWAGLGTHHGQTKRTTAESLRMYNTYLNKSGVHTPVAPPPAIDPSGDQSSARTLQSKSIARTAASQRQSNSPTIVPISMGGQQRPQRAAAAPPPPPGDGKPQRTNPVPTLRSNDDDNFFAMASKLTYGIVD